MQGLGVVDLSGVLPPGTDFRLTVQPSVVGLAVLLGFSERLFNQLGDQADRVLSHEPDSGSPASAGSPTATLTPTAVPGPREPSRAEYAADPPEYAASANGHGANANGGNGASPAQTDSR